MVRHPYSSPPVLPLIVMKFSFHVPFFRMVSSTFPPTWGNGNKLLQCLDSIETRSINNRLVPLHIVENDFMVSIDPATRGYLIAYVHGSGQASTDLSTRTSVVSECGLEKITVLKFLL